MQTLVPSTPEPPYRLVPFILLALLLHLALLLGIHVPMASFPATQKQTLNIYLAETASHAPHFRQDSAPQEIKVNSAQTMHSAATQTERPVAQPVQPAPVTAIPMLDPKQLVESARNIVRDEARKTEQEIAAQEKKRLNTPVATLNEYLRQPHKEIRLAYGMLKITTESGTSVCFQPVPYFARESAGLFGIPVTCP